MAYVSLYRKYRPQTFDDVVGQDHVTRTLRNAIEEDRLSHAYLFTGPRGTGKTSTARILAKAINCEQGPTPTPCGVCTHCTSITDGSSVDVIELDMASHGGVDDARELRDRALFAPASARRKVYILDEVHMASTAAFNALLKLIEEPPGHVLFAMATTDPQKVLPTIMSRVQRLDLRRVGAGALADHVRTLCANEDYTIDDGAIESVVRAGDGSVRDTLSVLEQVLAYAGRDVTAEAVAQTLGQTPVDRVLDTVDLLGDRDLAGLLGVVQGLLDDGHDLRRFTLDLTQHLRDLLVLQVAPDRPDLVDATDERRRRLQAQTTVLPRATLLRAVEKLAATITEQRQGSPRLPLELALAQLAVPGADGDVAELADRVARLEAGTSRSDPSAARRTSSRDRSTVREDGPATRADEPRPGGEAAVPTRADRPAPEPDGATSPRSAQPAAARRDRPRPDVPSEPDAPPAARRDRPLPDVPSEPDAPPAARRDRPRPAVPDAAPATDRAVPDAAPAADRAVPDAAPAADRAVPDAAPAADRAAPDAPDVPPVAEPADDTASVPGSGTAEAPTPAAAEPTDAAEPVEPVEPAEPSGVDAASTDGPSTDDTPAEAVPARDSATAGQDTAGPLATTDGPAAIGVPADGGAAAGDAAGDDATGDDSAAGDSAAGDATGGDATGGDATGGDATGGDATGGDATGGDDRAGDVAGGGDAPPEAEGLELLQAHWEGILELIKQGSRRHHAMIEPAIPVGVSRGILTLRYGRRHASFHAVQARSGELDGALRAAIEQACGLRLRIDVKVEGEDERRRPVPPSVTPDDARTPVLDDRAAGQPAGEARGPSAPAGRADASDTSDDAGSDDPTDADEGAQVREAELGGDVVRVDVEELLVAELDATLVDEVPPPGTEA